MGGIVYPGRILLLIFLLLMQASGSAFGEAGVFQFVAGDVHLADAAGAERAARKGDALNEGDTILTGRDGAAQIKMADGGFISVRSNTRMKVDTYIYSGKQDGSEKSFFSLLAGGFRALTGLIGKYNRDNYKITTPNATIGIRGTDHEPMVVLPGQSALGEPGTYDKVNSGASFIATAKGVININPSQVGFVPGANVAPVILLKVPAFYKESPPVPTEEERNLQKRQGAARTDGKDDRIGKGTATGGKTKSILPGESQPPDPDKAAAGTARLPATITAPVAADVVSGNAPPPAATGLPADVVKMPAAPVAPATAAPLLAPLPNLSTTTKLVVPMGTATTQPLIAPVTTTTTITPVPLAAPDSTSTTTAKMLDPALTTTIQPILTAPAATSTTTVSPLLTAPATTTTKALDPALTTTIQPVLTAPATTTVTPTIQPVLTAPTATMTTIQPVLTAPATTTVTPTIQPVLTAPTATTTTIQPVLTAPATTTVTPTTQPVLTAPVTTTTTTSPLLTAPLLSPTTTTIKTLP